MHLQGVMWALRAGDNIEMLMFYSNGMAQAIPNRALVAPAILTMVERAMHHQATFLPPCPFPLVSPSAHRQPATPPGAVPFIPTHHQPSMSTALPTSEPKPAPPYLSSKPVETSHLPPEHPYRHLLDLLSPSSDSTHTADPPPRLYRRLLQRLPRVSDLTPPDQPSFKHWFRLCWLDILTQLLCALVSLIICLTATPLAPRFFPLHAGIHATPWGQKYGQPYRSEFITTPVSAAVSFFVPFVVMSAVSGFYVGSFWDGNAAVSFFLFLHPHIVPTIPT